MSDQKKITPRELELIKLLAQGNTAQDCAKILGLSKFTVESYRKELMKKLGAKNSVQLVSHAYETGILTITPQ